MNLHFRLAKPSDLDKVFQVFESAIKNMISQNILQWDELYPQKSDLRDDILKKELYIGILDGEIASVYVLNSECDEQYKNGNWEYPNASYIVVHRLCVDPRFQNRGVGRETVKHIEEAVREKGIQSIRLDAFTENPFSLRMYEKAKYKIVGHADWRKGRFYLMEKGFIANEKINALRQEMKKENMAAYYVPTDDFHGSEYVSDYFKCRKYLSGFTGSAGVLVVTHDFAGLWTDGRYFIQAKQQLENTEIKLMKMGEPDVPTVEEFLAENLKPGDKLGFDGRCVNGRFVKELKEKLSSKEIFFEGSYDLVDRFWSERPKLSFHPVWELELSQSGIPRKEKLNLIREKMEEKGADAHLLTSLEDIAWLLNLRGEDIHCNPVFLSYLYITKDDCILFAGNRERDTEVFSKDIRQHLSEDGVRLQCYEDVYEFTAGLRNQKVLLDPKTVNQRLLDNLSAHCSLIFSGNFTTVLKALKNETELSNMRNAHIKDGAAVTKFLYYMKEYKKDLAAGQWKGDSLTEIKAAEILEGFRKKQDGYLGPSFDPIMAYGEHGAIVHYSAVKETDAALKAEGFLLSDTGGHYKDGTTDITRTISLAADPLSEEERRHYTLVLKANLALLSAKFPKGVCGNSLDTLAREPLWAEGLDFNHGTGHGVGYILSVHEGPNGFRTYRGKGKADMTAIVPGMVTSDEPGLYFEGKYGIRLENLIECVEEENGFYGFKPLTFVPFDRESIEPGLLNNREKLILNSYHKQVYDKISICLGEKEKDWLKKETAPIN